MGHRDNTVKHIDKSRNLKRLCGTLTTMEYHGLDKLLIEEAKKLERRIKLLEELDEELKASAEVIRKALNIR